MNPENLTWRLLTAEELTKVYLDEMRRDFPQSELKPLSMILNSEAAGTAHTWGIYDGDALAAYLLMVRPVGCAMSQLDYFAVLPRYRASGLGAALLAELPGHENGCQAIGGLCGYAGTHSNPDICLETEGFSTKNYPSVIDNCNVTVNIKANGATHVGGLVGTGLYYYGEETVFKITNCSVKGSIDGAVTPGTVAGRAEGSTIESCTADVTIDENAGTEQVGTTTQMYESADQ